MSDCKHLITKRIGNIEMQPKPPAVGLYQCQACGELLKAYPVEIRVVAEVHAEATAGN